jgi:antitoxin MazE
MQAKVAQWGGSLAVRLPRMAVEALGLRKGETVEMRVEDDALVLRKAASSYTLAELIAQAEGHTPPDCLDDHPVGAEVL